MHAQTSVIFMLVVCLCMLFAFRFLYVRFSARAPSCTKRALLFNCFLYVLLCVGLCARVCVCVRKDRITYAFARMCARGRAYACVCVCACLFAFRGFIYFRIYALSYLRGIRYTTRPERRSPANSVHWQFSHICVAIVMSTIAYLRLLLSGSMRCFVPGALRDDASRQGKFRSQAFGLVAR